MLDYKEDSSCAMAIDKTELDKQLRIARSNILLRETKLRNAYQKIEEIEELLVKSEASLDLHKKSIIKQKETSETIDLAFYKASIKMYKKEKDNRDSLKKELEKYKYQVILYTDLIRKDEGLVKKLEAGTPAISNVIYLKK